MNKEQFIKDIESKSKFLKWASGEQIVKDYGTVKHYRRDAFVSTEDGRNIMPVFYMEDTETNETIWQNQDTIDTNNRLVAQKLDALKKYLASNFDAYFLNPERIDLDNNWAEATVYEINAGKLTRSEVIVFKRDSKPISHLPVITV